jgi:prepilin-type N-terminal cleavage/methylation domain-containing protein
MLRAVKGFTLIEIAIVLVIVGLLLGGLLMPLATQVETQRRTETQKALKEINEAIIGFALANGRLPCPANPATPTGTVNAGVERLAATACAGNVRGVVPWVTLGVSELDAWGRRFTYRVTNIYADRTIDNTVDSLIPSVPPCTTLPTNASFALCSPGDMRITVGPLPTAADVALAIPAIIVSHGKNGRGAYLPTGIQMTCPALPPPGPSPPPLQDEIENTDCPGDTPIFVSRTPTSSVALGGEFDDIVTWIVPSILKNRMVAAGLLD